MTTNEFDYRGLRVEINACGFHKYINIYKENECVKSVHTMNDNEEYTEELAKEIANDFLPTEETKKMNKNQIINKCIDLSYSVSKEYMNNAIKSIHNDKFVMETKDSKAQWQKLFEKLSIAPFGKDGNLRLFLGSNVEAYRRK